MEELGRPVVKDVGMTVLHEPQPGTEAIADLCFIHGLGGHPQKTWSFGKPHKSRSTKSRWRERLGLGKNGIKVASESDTESTPTASSDTGPSPNARSFCYWPFDLVPKEFPNIRVLSYGYDSHPTHFYKHKTTQMTISQHALDLLSKITNARTKSQGRPLIFVAHSLGGIIVKDMIIESVKHKAQPNMRDAADSLRAIIFFGTPHLGAPSAEWGQILTNLVNVIGISTYKGVLRGLSPDSEKLAAVNRDFTDILDDRSAGPKKIDIYNFQEGRPITSLKLFDGKIVPDTSSWLNRRTIERVSMIQTADHLSMCKFKSANDAGFEDFRAAIESYLLADSHGQNTVSDEPPTSSSEQEPDLLQSLDFANRFVRVQQIDQVRTVKESFEWIWSSNFVAWLRNDHPVFWICGYPASGKSTLINHFVSNEQIRRTIADSHDGNWTLIYHFFDFRAGDGVANNFSGFLQSVLIQIFNSVPRLKYLASSQCRRKMQTRGYRSWSSSELERLLEVICADESLYFCLFLDGLDEYSGSVIELVSFINQISSVRRKVCIASRPDPPLPDAFRSAPKLMMHILNRPGIEAFATRMLSPYLETVPSFQTTTIEQLASDIVARSRRVFLWTRFAILDLIDGMTRGEDITTLRRRLDNVPEQLTEVYARILNNRTKADKSTLSLMLLFVVYAFYPLTVGELYLALGHSPQFEKEIRQWMKEYDQMRFVKVVNAASGSLLEIVVSSNANGERSFYFVRTIHRTVQTFLDEGGWNILLEDVDHQVLADELWLHVCAEILNKSRLSSLRDEDVSFALQRQDIVLNLAGLGVTNATRIDDPDHISYPQLNDSRKVLLDQSIAGVRDYALAYLLKHARRYEHLSKRSSYPKIRSIISQASFLALHQMAWDDGTCDECRYLEDGHSRFSGLLSGVAIAHGLSLFIRDMLQTDQFWTQMTPEEHEENKENVNEALQVTKNLALQCVISCADGDRIDILRMLLGVGASLDDIDIVRTIFEGSPDAVRFVLQYQPPGLLLIQFSSDNFRPWIKDPWSSRVGPLFLVTQRRADADTEEILDLFLKRGEVINGQYCPDGTALHGCGSKFETFRFSGMVELLISRGADVNAQGPEGRPLELLWRQANLKTFKAKYSWDRGHAIRNLIKHGAVNEVRDPNGLVPSVERMVAWGAPGWSWLTDDLRRARRYYFNGPDDDNTVTSS